MMETLTKLSARSLEYYINARRWKTDLEFFNVEFAFLNRLMQEHFLELAGEDRIRKLTRLGSKLSELMNEKHQIKELLDHQLRDLELMADDLLEEGFEAVARKQADLEYHMVDLVNEFREIKTELYAIMEAVLDERRLLVN